MASMNTLKKAVIVTALATPLVLTACSSPDKEEAEATSSVAATTTTATTSTKTKTEETTPTKTEEQTTTVAAEPSAAAEGQSEADIAAQKAEVERRLEEEKAKIQTITNGAPADPAVVQQLTDLATKVNTLDPNADIAQYFCAADRNTPEFAQTIEYRRNVFNQVQQLNMAIPAPKVSLADVKTEGDRASAQVTVNIEMPGAAPQVTPQNFIKEDGAWKVSTQI